MYGWYLAHQIGDLVKVLKINNIHLEHGSNPGALGMVVGCPGVDGNGGLFVEVYIFKIAKTIALAPSEMIIISNIGD
tara:strand:- start:732 stop:962 length:231 start_codon:yes stop_codon:yes gene_type:complete